MKKYAVLLLMLFCFQLVVPTPPASALVVTDVTANKTLLAIYAKFTAMFAKLSSMYTVSKGHLDSAVEVENMMSDAYDTYTTIVNLDLEEIIEDFQSDDGLYSDNPFGRLGTVQNITEEKVSLGQGNIDFATSQKNRIKNLRRLSKLKIASVKNMGKANRDIPQRKSNQITAQSTTTLAILASIEQREKERKALETERLKKEGKKAESHMGKIYGLIGPKDEI